MSDGWVDLFFRICWIDVIVKKENEIDFLFLDMMTNSNILENINFFYL